MCGPVISAIGALASGIGGLVGAAKADGASKQPKVSPPPQPTSQPDQAGARKRPQSAAGAQGTMLTGASGVDPAQLALGKNTLLGG